MTTTVYLENGQQMTLDNSKVIGSGGEGSVFHNPHDAKSVIKIYETPTPEHEKKLKAFLAKGFSLPQEVAAPQSLILNRSGRVIGFTMNFFNGTKPIREFSNRKFRIAHGINNRQVTTVSLHEASLLNSIHSQGIVVGDLNDQNVFFADLTSYFIDVDSWQFDNWACPVATESFLDPQLYGVNLSLRPVFKPAHDWYSYAVTLFRSLLLIHPYGGTHPQIDGLLQRATKKITIFDKDVIYPAIGLPPDLLSNDLLQVFNRYFHDGWRGQFPTDALKLFQSSLTQCPSCQTDYPSERRACPVCKQQNLAVTAVSIPGSITLKKLLEFKGQVLSAHLEGDTLVLIVIDNNQAFLHLANLKGIESIPLFPYQKGMHIEASKRLVAANQAGSQELSLFEIKNGQIDFVMKGVVTDINASTQNTVFRVVDNHLYRIVGSQLVDCEIVSGHLLNKALRPTIENQSWFTTSSEPNPTHVGFYRVLRQYFFWVYRQGFSADLEVPQLDLGEGLIDLSIKFSGSSLLIIRKTEFKGESFIRFDYFDKEGKRLYSTKHNSKSLPSDSIHGLAFAGGKIIYPTDLGAVRFDPIAQASTTFSATNKIVDSSQALYAYQSGLLVLSSKNLSYLTQN